MDCILSIMAQSSKAPPGSLAKRKGEVGWCNMVESSFRMSPYKDTGERRSQCHAAPQESNSMQGGVAGGHPSCFPRAFPSRTYPEITGPLRTKRSKTSGNLNLR